MEQDIVQVRSVHNDIYSLYTDDIAKYEKESRRKLKTQRIFVLPIEVKSGKDYKVHSALDTFLHHSDYGIEEGVVLSNERCISQENGVWYLPIYMVMFFTPDTNKNIYF